MVTYYINIIFIANLLYSQISPYQFVFKCEFNYNSFRVIILAFVYSCLVLGLMFRFAEEQYHKKIEGEEVFTYKNSVWIWFITMSTVGYGEISPVSLPGKMVAMYWAFLGVILQSATVIATLNTLQMTKSEDFSYVLICIVDIKDKMLYKATRLLQVKFRLK